MFPPKVIGVIGNLGKMATNIVIPLFREAGYEVIGSDAADLQGLTNREVVERADIVYFSIMPIDSVSSVIAKLIPHARPNTLWLHGTSIQNPCHAPIISTLLDQRLADHKVDVGFLHFMVGPMIRSLRGQSVIYGFPRELALPEWEQCLIDILEPKKPFLVELSPELHDKWTAGSQAIPMIFSIVIADIWRMQNIPMSDVLRISGPPAWMQIYSIARNLLQPDIVENIITNHPGSLSIVDQAIRTLYVIREAVVGRVKLRKRIINRSLAFLGEETLSKIKQSTDWHIRLEGDMRGGAVCFSFPPEKNQLGLLTKVLSIFDEQGLDKTSCMAQETSDGGCTFFVGLKLDPSDSRVQAACLRVVNELSGNQVVI